MEFSDLLDIFTLQQAFYVDSYILGQRGYVLVLQKAVTYIFEETRGNGRCWMYLNQDRMELSEKEVAKVHSLLRLHQIEPRKLDQKDFWLYSAAVERSMSLLVDRHPHLAKGSAHLAFAPRNYTRFSENLVFDFDYLYDDSEIATTIDNFEESYRGYGSDQKDSVFSDVELYRILLDHVRRARTSINGRVSLPYFLNLMFARIQHFGDAEILLNTGPYLIQLRKKHLQLPFISRKTPQLVEELELKARVVTFTGPDVESLLSDEDKFGQRT